MKFWLSALAILTLSALLGAATARAQAEGPGAAALAALAATGPLACDSAADPAAPAAVRRILCARQIRIGLRDDYPGFAARAPGQSGAPVGFEVDVARTLASRLGLSPRFETVTAVTRLSALSEGRADLVIATMGHNSQRDRAARFLRTHYYSSETIVVGPEALPIAALPDLAGRSVCSTVGNYANSELAPEAARLMLFRSPAQLVGALEAGQCTLIAQDDSLLANWLADPAFAARFARKLGFLPVPWGAAMPLGTPAPLAAILEAEIEAMHRDGTMLRLARAHALPSAFLEEQAELWRQPACISDPATCRGAPLEIEPQVRVQLMEGHAPRYAGFYVADITGLYAQLGIGAQLIEGGALTRPLDALVDGHADVAVAWMGDALAYRAEGHDIVNVAQILARPGAILVCRRDAGIAARGDLDGKRIAVRGNGDAANLSVWLLANGVAPGKVQFVPLSNARRDLLEGHADCASILSARDYQEVLEMGTTAGSMLTFRMAQDPAALPEDGLYVRRDSLLDPDRRDAIARFVAGSVNGWRVAGDAPDEALIVGSMLSPELSAATQQDMLRDVLERVADGPSIGLLDLGTMDLPLESAIKAGPEGPVYAALLSDEVRQGLWTQDIWYETGLATDSVLRPRAATLHYFAQVVGSQWFYMLDLIGTVAFGLAGFLRARERQFDLWGALILTMLPAVGGGTLRDLLIGGDRSPPFVFKDITYMMLVFATLAAGLLGTWLAPALAPGRKAFDRLFLFADTLGLAAFTVIGTKVALIAGLDWVWAPFCAALTCAGGGMLVDIVTGREPRTFKGEPYEEIAIVGSLLMLVLLECADRLEGVPWVFPPIIIATMAFVFVIRLVVVRYNLRSPRLRIASAGGASAA